MDILRMIKDQRELRNWSEYKLAKKSGIPQTTISSWYRNNTTPTIFSLEKICDGFGITLAEFFSIDEQPGMENKEESRLIALWLQLTPEEKNCIYNTMECFLSK